MVKHFLWCFGESQGVTIAFFDCIGRCVGTAPPTPRFAASTCGWRTLGVAFRFGVCRSASWPSGSRLPLFGTHRFGVALGGLAFGLTTSAFRHAPLRKLPSAGWFFRWAGWSSGSRLPLFDTHRFGVAAGRVGLRVHCFRFSACAASEWPLGEFVLPPSVSEIALGGLAFGLTASAFRHAPLRGCPRRVGSSAFRFGDCRSAGWPSGSRLPLFGTHRFGVALGELVLLPSASEIAARQVGLRAHRFRFSARTVSGLPLGELVLLPSASEIATRQVGASARRVGLRAHDFRFSACTASELPLGELALPLGELVLLPSVSEIAARWVGLRAHASGLPSASWPSGSRLPLFGTHRFGVALGGLALPPSVSALPLGELAFGLTASAFRHAPLRSCPRRVGASAFRFGVAARRVGLRAHCFRFSARIDPHRRTAEARTDGAQRHDTCFTSKHLSQHVNLPHRTP